MGLDMFLMGRYNVRFGSESEKLGAEIESLLPDLADIPSHWGPDTHKVREITVDLGYWRKANAIHRWFVENCQDGVDDCGTYPVSRANLQTLLELCQRVLGFRHLAEEQLPTLEGFFFGGTAYDDAYYQDVEDTIKIIKDCLRLSPNWDFEYHSSW